MVSWAASGKALAAALVSNGGATAGVVCPARCLLSPQRHGEGPVKDYKDDEGTEATHR